MLICAGVKLYVIGWEYNFSENGMSYGIKENNVEISSHILIDKYAYKGYKVEKQDDDTQKLVVYECMKSPLHKSKDFTIYIPLSEINSCLVTDGPSFKPNGMIIDRFTNILFDAKNPYIGDMSANMKIADLLSVSSHSAFESELQTDKKPYRWTIKFKDVIIGEERLNREMKYTAFIMLALIDNADEIAWNYLDYAAPNDEKSRITKVLTTKEAYDILGKDIKDYGESPENLQKLFNKLSELN